MGYPSWRAARRQAHADADRVGVPHIFYREYDSFTVKSIRRAQDDGSLAKRPLSVMLPDGTVKIFAVGENLDLDKGDVC